MIHYRISSTNPAAHYFDIRLKIASPDPAGQLIRMPAWIPGSYMIRDFARNIVEISAFSNAGPIALTQLDKSSWQLAPCTQPVTVSYRVYAWDLSVRGAHLDTTHGYFNGASVFLEVVGQGSNPCSLEIIAPQIHAAAEWQLATSLRRQDAGSASDVEWGFGHFVAHDYQELIDHPVEMGRFTQFDFSACGVRHDVVLSGRFNCDNERLASDLKRICEQQIRLFGEPAPMPRYVFMVMVVGEGYGGLEHRDSTSLICSRNDLPQPGQSQMSEEYRNFLGLCSHEYFHSWNVKRIKPAPFEQPDLTRELYTPLLWAFEGITSYYDDLALVRSGCVSRQSYLELLGQTITRVQRSRGRARQSAAESSFNAWSKFYKQDENSQNAIVSYYTKGALIALCIDLKLRQLSGNKKSLDDVMRLLWTNYLQTGQGIGEYEIQQTITQLLGADISGYLEQLIYSREELPLSEMLQSVSIGLEFRPSSGAQDKGGKEASDLPASSTGVTLKESVNGLDIVSLAEGSAAQLAGVSAGDCLIAINGLRASMKSYQLWLKTMPPGSQHQLSVFRRDELMQFDLVLQQPDQDTALLKILDANDTLLNDWLSAPEYRVGG